MGPTSTCQQRPVQVQLKIIDLQPTHPIPGAPRICHHFVIKLHISPTSMKALFRLPATVLSANNDVVFNRRFSSRVMRNAAVLSSSPSAEKLLIDWGRK